MLNKRSKNLAVWNTIAHFNHSDREYEIAYLKVSFVPAVRNV